MGYAICRIEKIKTSKEMTSRYKHNYREYEVANANGNLSDMNIEVKGLNGKNYSDVSSEELIRMRLNGYCGRKERSDAVKGLEIVLSYSYEDKDNISLDRWIEKNVEWLEKSFNPKDHEIMIEKEDGSKRIVKSDNVKSIMVHLDEAVPHIHAFVVPIDEKGALNAKRYTYNRQMMREYQTSYSQTMQEFGLKRGAENQKTTFEDITKYHNELKNVVSAELPEPFIGEDVFSYKKRANKEYQREKIHHRNDVLKLKQEIKEAKAETLSLTLDRDRNAEKISKQIIRLSKEMAVPELDDMTVQHIRHNNVQLEKFKKAVDEYPDREYADQVYNDFQNMINWQMEREKQRKKKERSKTHKNESA